MIQQAINAIRRITNSNPQPPNLTLEEVEVIIRETDTLPPPTRCYICLAPPVYKMIGLKDEYNTVEVEKIGYVCERCAKSGKVNPLHYKLLRVKE